MLDKWVVVARDACCRVVPHKVSSGDWDRLDIDFLREELYVALIPCRMASPQVWMVFLVSFTRPCGTPLVMIYVVWLLKCFLRSAFRVS
jgi:hypothetical protein